MKILTPIQRSFLCGGCRQAKKINLIWWEDVGKPKSDGGLGIKKNGVVI